MAVPASGVWRDQGASGRRGFGVTHVHAPGTGVGRGRSGRRGPDDPSARPAGRAFLAFAEERD
jgi:hypothetical protein